MKPDLICFEINRVDLIRMIVDPDNQTDRNVISGFQVLFYLAVFEEQDILSGLPQPVRAGQPSRFPKACHCNAATAFKFF